MDDEICEWCGIRMDEDDSINGWCPTCAELEEERCEAGVPTETLALAERRDMYRTDSKHLLDHGYIKLIETWGSDERIIESARQSTDGSFRGWGEQDCPECNGTGESLEQQKARKQGKLFDAAHCEKCKNTGKIAGDEKLLRFLYKNSHSTPFEMAGAIIEVQAPIFVFREWHRHRTQSYNELSARYTPLPDLYYVPTVERCILNSKTNKQAGRAKDAEELTEEKAQTLIDLLRRNYDICESGYQDSLRLGLPKELARCIMPVGHYSRMRASANLRNWLAFLTLRQAPNAQWEIRQYANALADMLTNKFPRTMALYREDD